MERLLFASVFLIIAASACVAQSRNTRVYSESAPTLERKSKENITTPKRERRVPDSDVIRIETDLIIVPTQVIDRSGRAVVNIRKNEFKIFEDGVEQEIAYFAAEEQPFTVALLLDMSYSSLFKIDEIRSAAMTFVSLLKPEDRVMIVAFDEKVRVLCKPTNNRYALKLAIESTKIGSGTSIYSAVAETLNDNLAEIKGRKAVVILSDGVDTTSRTRNAAALMDSISETDVIFYPIQYDTFADVQKSRQNQAEIQYDDDDRPYSVIKPPVKGEREEDYRVANEFLGEIAARTGGRKFNVKSKTNLAAAFRSIADELRRVYSLGYYPSSDREVGVRYAIKVRVYRPDLVVRARSGYQLGPDK